MSWPDRVMLDVSYTRTQHGNVGITRTVRRLLQELPAALGLPPGSCIPVAFHASGFRAAGTTGPVTSAPSQDTPSNAVAARFLRFFMSGWGRRLVSRCLPGGMVRLAWRLHGAWAFNALSAAETPVRFQPGDLLVLGDQSWNYQAWVAASRARAQGARVVLIVYDLIPVRHPEFCNRLFSRVFEQWLLRMVDCVDVMLCISRATQEDLRGFFTQRCIDAPALASFRLGSDLDMAGAGEPVREAIRAFAGGAAPCFFAVGTVEPRKNYALLLAAFERLWAAGQDVKLLIVGRINAESDELAARLLRHEEQEQRLLCVQDAGDSEVAWLYSHCRALVFPSLAEGFGLPLVEARTRGCPVIASDLPAFLELADEGVWVFPRHSVEALHELVLDHAATDRRASCGRLPMFTWGESAVQLLQAVNIEPGPVEDQVCEATAFSTHRYCAPGGEFKCSPANPSNSS